MKQMWENVKGFFGRDWTIAEKVLIILCFVLIGMIKGFILAPIKQGIHCGNNNGNVYNEPEDESWLDEEE